MKKRDNHNTVDIRVGSQMRQWIMNTYGTDLIKLNRNSNLWMIIKENLELRPRDYTPLDDRSEYVSFVLLTNGGNTRAYRQPTKENPLKCDYQPNMLFRCMISCRGENIVRGFLERQFRNAFHNYMKGALNNNPDMKIVDAVTEFLTDAKQPSIDNRTIAALVKDWYRYRRKNDDEFAIPIFF